MHEGIGIILVIVLALALCVLWVTKAVQHRNYMLDNNKLVIRK